MHRAVLEALITPTIALAAGFVLLRLLIRFSGAKLSLRRLRRVHRCEIGAVQSLSFVLTLPLFIMIVMFIVQVSQLMVGIMGVHYATFAAARSATVWSAAHTAGDSGYYEEHENMLQRPFAESSPLVLAYRDIGTGQPISNSLKLNKAFSAAVAAVAPIAPSRPLVEIVDCSNCGIQPSLVAEMYRVMVPQSAGSSKINSRIRNKLSYAFWNTTVTFGFIDKDTRDGPTYNPRVLRVVDGMPTQDRAGEWVRDWNPHEVGWQDPLIMIVRHDFALLPGPGRFLAKYIVRADGQADRVAPRIVIRGSGADDVPWIDRAYTTSISASATLTNEGLKPLLSYVQTFD